MSDFRGDIVIVLGDNFNAEVFHDLKDCLMNAGAPIVVAGIEKGRELIDSTGNELVRLDAGIADISELDFDALVLVDGSQEDDLRGSEEFHELLRRAHDSGTFIGAIDQSIRYLIDAGLAPSHSFTCSPALRYELEMHTAQYQNEPVWVDGSFVSGRILEDMQPFCSELVSQIQQKKAA